MCTYAVNPVLVPHLLEEEKAAWVLVIFWTIAQPMSQPTPGTAHDASFLCSQHHQACLAC